MRRRVLVVDDDPLIRTVSKRALERAGIDVVVTPSIAETLRHIRGRVFHTAILDYFLGPGECGCDLIAPLRTNHPGIRIVVLSGLSVLAELVHHAHTAGANLVASKASVDWLALAAAEPVAPPPVRAAVDLAALRRDIIHGSFLVHRRNVSRTARALRIPRSSLQRTLRKMPLPDPREE